MRSVFAFALAGLASFGVGFLSVQFFSKGAARVAEERTAVRSIDANSAVAPTSEQATGLGTERVAAIIALGGKARGLNEDHALFLAISQLKGADFVASAAELRALTERTDDSVFGPHGALSEAWMERWLKVDEAGALRFLEGSGLLQELSAKWVGWGIDAVDATFVGGVLKALARRESEWVRAYVTALEPGKARDIGSYLLLREAASADPAKAKQLFSEVSAGSSRPAALKGYIAGLAVSDVRTGFEIALAEAAGPLRDELLNSTINAAAKRGVGTVQTLLDQVDDAALRRKVASAALITWSIQSQEDPLPWIMEEARRKVAPTAMDAEYDAWRQGIATALQAHGAAPAADWAMALDDEPEKKTLSAILGRWSQNDLPSLRDWLGARAAVLPPAMTQQLENVMFGMMRNEPAETRAWAETLPPGRLRDQVQFHIALNAGAEGDVTRASEVYETLAATDTSGALAKQLALVLAKQNGPAAAEWALQRPEGPARTVAIATVAEQWSERDPRGAAQWLGQMPVGAERDGAVLEYAGKVVYADPTAAAEWVEQVGDPATRAKAAERVFGTWNWEDPLAARVWLRALSGVDEAWRADFLRKQK